MSRGPGSGPGREWFLQAGPLYAGTFIVTLSNFGAAWGADSDSKFWTGHTQVPLRLGSGGPYSPGLTSAFDLRPSRILRLDWS